MRKQPTGVTGPVDLPRLGDPKPGDPKLNRRLMAPQPNVEQTSFIRDRMYAWPSMYDLARSLTGGKWGKGGKWK